MKKLFTLLTLSLFIFNVLEISAQRSTRRFSLKQNPQISVELSRADAYSDGNGAFIKFTTFSEANTVGFNIYRFENGEKIFVNKTLIPAAHLRSPDPNIAFGEYDYFDPSGNINVQYFIESIDAQGITKSFTPILAEYVSDLTPFAGSSSEFLQTAKKESETEITTSDLIVPKELAIEKASLEADNDSNVQKFVASQPGVKIGVKEEGVYRVTRAQLSAAGFDVSTSPSKWQLFKNGVQQNIIVEPNGDYIEFYGKGIDTFETDTQNYFLISGTDNGNRILSRAARTVGSTVSATGYNQTFEKKERKNYFSSIFNGDQENFFGTIITATGAEIFFNLTSLQISDQVSVVLTLQGLSANQHKVRVIINGTDLGYIEGVNRNKMAKTFTIASSLLREGDNSLQLASSSSGDLALFDNIKISYKRGYLAQNNSLSTYTQHYRFTNLTGFTSPNIRVFDITSPNQPILLNKVQIFQEGSTYTARIPSYRSRLIYAVANEGLKSPATIVLNTPSTLSSESNSGKLIIIKHKNFTAPANDWAGYRSGTSLKVVDVEDIYDEFNYGNFSADAIKEFLRFAEYNWQVRPDYVLLIGDASYDSRNYLGFGNWNLVPTRMVDTSYSETGSDDALADFNNDGLAEIAIGRIPARTADNVTLALNKVINFEANLAGATSRGALCVSDEPTGYDFAALCGRIFSQLPDSFNKSFIARPEPDSASKVKNSLDAGKYITNYSGHGSTTAWAVSSFFHESTARQLTNDGRFTIFTLLTCLNGYFVEPNGTVLAESALFAPNGGAVAAWASTGLTTPDVQEIMAKRFYSKIGDGSIPRMGDLVNDAKTTIPNGRDVRLSWALLGDPMLKVR